VTIDLNTFRALVESVLESVPSIVGLESEVPAAGATVAFTFWWDSHKRLVALNVALEGSAAEVERIATLTEALDVEWSKEDAAGFSLAALALPTEAAKPEAAGYQIWLLFRLAGVAVYGIAPQS
jgi:hypothetical protein